MSSKQDIKQFAEDLQGKVSDSTLRMYVYSLNIFFDGLNGNMITPEIAQAYLDALTRSGKSPSTVSLRAHAIMRFFKWKKMNVHLECPPIRMKKPEYLKPDEVSRVIMACQTNLEKTIVVMLYDTAVRISELLNLTVNDIDWYHKTITVVRKGGWSQEVNVSALAMDEVRKWLSIRQSKSEKVFLDLDYYAAWSMIKKIGKRAGVPIHPHIFRHSRAISMLKSGAKPYVVKQHLGHRSISTTLDIYGAFMAADLREEIPEWSYE